jgi:hypothetical protein
VDEEPVGDRELGVAAGLLSTVRHSTGKQMPEQPRGSASVHQSNLHRFGTNFLTLPPIGCYRALNQIGKTRNSYRRGQQLAPGQYELVNGLQKFI